MTKRFDYESKHNAWETARDFLVQDRLLLAAKGSHFIPSQTCLHKKRQMSAGFLTGSHPARAGGINR